MKLNICTACLIVVPADVDACPNVAPHLHGLDPRNHPIRVFVPQEAHASQIALAAVGAAEASLELVRAAIR